MISRWWRSRQVGKQIAAGVLGLISGLAGLGALLLIAWRIYERLWNDSLAALVLLLLIFGIAGVLVGWFLGMLVFSAVRGE
jgi:hypothetical protein